MHGNIKGKENFNFTSYNTDNTKYNNIFIKNKKNQEPNKDKTKNEFENEIKSNSGTSISSNNEVYNNFVSKIIQHVSSREKQIQLLKNAIKAYENGEILEAKGLAIEFINNITDFEESEE